MNVPHCSNPSLIKPNSCFHQFGNCSADRRNAIHCLSLKIHQNMVKKKNLFPIYSFVQQDSLLFKKLRHPSSWHEGEKLHLLHLWRENSSNRQPSINIQLWYLQVNGIYMEEKAACFNICFRKIEQQLSIEGSRNLQTVSDPVLSWAKVNCTSEPKAQK